MAFTSLDNMISNLTAATPQFYRSDFCKLALNTTTQVAGQWYDLYQGAGNPPLGVYGSALGTNTMANTTVTAGAAQNGSGTVTVTTAVPHGLVGGGSGSATTNGSYIVVTASSSTTAFPNGTYQVNTVVDPTHFTITAGSGGAVANINANYALQNLSFYPLADSGSFILGNNTTFGIGGIMHGGNVSTATKHLLNMSAFTAAATTVPCVLILVDILGFVPISTVTTTGVQNISQGGFRLPRYTDGKSVQAFISSSNVMGANTPTFQLTYTNPAGTGSRVTPLPLPLLNTTAPAGSIPYSGTGSGKFGPFIPRAAGDNGILSAQSVNFSLTMTSGFTNLVFAKQIASIPLTTIGVAGERDLLNNLPSLPRIYDGANLALMVYAGAATPVSSSFFGHLDFGWA